MSDKLICDCCLKEFNELYTRETTCHGYVVEWVCLGCYEVTYGLEWSYDIEDVPTAKV